jgi:hypothetical protein
MYVESGKRGAYEPEVLELIIGVYVATCDAAELDPLLVVSQLILETDNLTAGHAFARPLLDPIGIAAAKDPGGTGGFRSWLEAARVHVGVLLGFALPSGETPVQRELLDDARRWQPLLDELRGSAPTLDLLPRAWNAPPDYAERIRAIANTILEPQY